MGKWGGGEGGAVKDEPEIEAWQLGERWPQCLCLGRGGNDINTFEMLR